MHSNLRETEEKAESSSQVQDNGVPVELRDKIEKGKTKTTRQEYNKPSVVNNEGHSSLYSKLSKAVIPPIKQSVNLLHSEFSSYPSKGKRSSDHEAKIESKKETFEEDESDAATVIGGVGSVRYICDLFTTISLVAGLKSLPNNKEEQISELSQAIDKAKNIYKDIPWKNLSASENIDSGSDTENDNVESSLEDDRGDYSFHNDKESSSLDLEFKKIDLIDATHTPNDENSGNDFPAELSDEDFDEINEGVSSNLFKPEANIQQSFHSKDKRSDSETSINSDSYRNSPEELTLLQKSFVENFDTNLKESILIKVKDNYECSSDIRETSDKRDHCLKIADRLQKVFSLKNDDYFYGNFETWLVRDVLLQGHLYITRDSILFFAFLPHRYSTFINSGKEYTKYDDSHEIIQSGCLGLKSAKYGDSVFNTVITHRYWAILRRETLSIYVNSTDLYYPITIVDLKTCIKVEILDDGPLNSPRSESEKVHSSIDSSLEDDVKNENEDIDGLSGGVWFKVVTTKKTYKFHTDSVFVARKWCNNITKIIFQHQNSNSKNEVLLKIPIENIIDINRSLLFAEKSDDDDVEEVDTPMSVFLRYLNDEQDKEKSLKMKGKGPLEKSFQVVDDSNIGIDDIYFLFFKQGEEFYKVLNRIIYEHFEANRASSSIQNNSSDDVLSQRKSTLHDKDSQVGMSTLHSSIHSNTLVDQITCFNDQSSNINEQFVSGKKEKNDGQLSKLQKMSKNLRSPTKIFGLKKEQVNSSPKEGYIIEKPEIQHYSRSPSPSKRNVHFPRPISIAGLKKLQMSFEATQISFDPFTEKEAVEDSTINQERTISSDSISLQRSHSQLSYFPGPLTLSEPDENEGKTSSSKKLAFIGRSIKSISNASSMWLSNPTHFEEVGEDDPYFVRNDSTREISQSNFHNHFFLEEESLIASYYIHLQRAIPIYGKVYLGKTELCFRSLLPGISTRLVLPLVDIETCHKEKGLRLTWSGLVLIIRGAERILLEFSSQKTRDDCEMMILRQLSKVRVISNKSPSDQSRFSDQLKLLDDRTAFSRIGYARMKLFEDRLNAAIGLDIPIILEDSSFFKVEVKPAISLKFTLLTVGSRGDVQPYIALGKALIKEGHMVTIATHSEFEEWILSHGLNFKEIAGNPAELMSLMVTHGSMSVGFIKEASSKFRGWIDDLLKTSWKACQGSDILIESPSAICGIHIAEALGIPYMRAFTMPWTRTRAYPHAFIVPDQKRGGSYNYLTHLMFETIFWKGLSGQINKWRREDLGLPRTNLFRLKQAKTPFLYNVSPTVFPPSVDFPDWVRVTGYWFLDEGLSKSYQPDPKLVEFMQHSKRENKKLVYIGFGSIVVNDAKSLTRAIVDAVLSSDVMCILNKGWSDRLTKKDEAEAELEIELPPTIFSVNSIPHDWLFARIDAAVHHGGSGTTGATLRAGIPTIIKPFFGDQFFYAARIEEIGAGLTLRNMNAKSLSKALKTVLNDERIFEKAKNISKVINHENGVLTAIETIYSEYEYARSLILSKQQYNESYYKKKKLKSGTQTPIKPENEVED